MWQVLQALLPGILVMAWFFGVGVFINIVLAIFTALAAESLILLIRGRAVTPALTDLSAVLSAVLLALCLPAIAPWWLAVLGTLFAIVIAKQLYGGLGYNLFNPAMAGYVFLLISFPKHMTGWLAPGSINAVPLSIADTFNLIFSGQLPANVSFDGITMATPLDTIKTQLGLQQNIGQITTGTGFGLIAGKGWEWVALAYLLGGIKLLRDNVISWHIPLSFLASLALCSGLFYLFDSKHFASPLFHVFAGGSLLGAFFIATDPVTAATSNQGRIVFGILIGLLLYIIRVWGGYPDGVAFAVLLANLTVPAIDYFTRPRVFGIRP
jgi:electron transport complex protein RnfD